VQAIQYLGILSEPRADGTRLDSLGLSVDPTVGEVQEAHEGTKAKVLV
jgi:hypothetical protein